MKPEFPAVGKAGKLLLEKLILPKLGAARTEVLVGPQHGCDNGVIRLNDRQVLVITTDPLSIIPALGIEDSAWLTVHLIASDLATSGFSPQYGVFDLNLPVEITTQEFEAYWHAIHRECEKLGIAIVAGHTGKFVGCDYTIVGGGMMAAVGDAEKYLAPSMAQPGNRVVITKGAAIATTGILARVFPETIKKQCGEETYRKAVEYFRKFSVVDDALSAVSTGVREEGVTALHDATEGGVLGALCELAAASNCGIRVEKSAIAVSEETHKVCELFHLDPLVTLSEGTLVAAVLPDSVQAVIGALASQSIQAFDVGVLSSAEEGCWVEAADKHEPLVYPEVDPYWKAYADAMQKGWK